MFLCSTHVLLLYVQKLTYVRATIMIRYYRAEEKRFYSNLWATNSDEQKQKILFVVS